MNLGDQSNEIWNHQMGTAIEFMASGGRTFSAKDIADFEEWEGLEGVIENALQHQCRNGTMIRLDGSYDDEDSYPRYLSLETARRWWVNFTLRLVDTDVDCVTAAQLAKSMSLALDNGRIWKAPPNSLLDVGREWALVADGCVPDTYVFPWVTLIRGDPRFRSVFLKLLGDGPEHTWGSILLESAVDEALSRLTDREAQIIRLRFGLSDAKKHTLEEVGGKYGVTRERIRQIEARGLRKLRHPTRSRVLRLGSASEFVRSGGSFLLFESERTSNNLLLEAVFGRERNCIPELGVSVLTETDVSEFLEYLGGDYWYSLDDKKLAAFLPFLSKSDAERLWKPLEKLKRDRIMAWSRPRMLLEALRSLGRAAHFAEIAERCNEMFPNRENAIRNWHSALSQPSAEELGIVWIGRKGMYGLQKHGYSRPTKDLFDSAADIVERVYANTGQPVPDSVVILEMGKVRREAHHNSIIMALGFSERLKSAGGGRYIPIGVGIGGPDKSPTLPYDISAAFEAFSSEGKDE